jgi:trigger factor
MNITLNRIDPVNATLTIEVVKDDYAQKVKQNLKEIGKTATIPGFRKGMVPPAILQKMYGKSVLIEEVNKLVTNQLSDYIKESELNLLGEPLPGEELKPLDFDKEDFQFIFDLGFAPELTIRLTKEDKIPCYNITVNDEMIEKQISRTKERYSTYEQVDDIQGNDMPKGILTELNDDGSPKENGIFIDDAVLMPSYIKEEEEKKKFMGAKLGEVITFNPNKAFDGTEAELTSFLKIKKEELKNHAGNFTFEIKEITRHKEAEVNQELFDKMYEPGTVTSEEQFKEKIREMIALDLIPESNYRFFLDARKLLEDKTKELQFPDAFLKRWLLLSSPDQTAEAIEKEYPQIIANLKFHLIKQNIFRENNIEITEENLLEAAIENTREQFIHYGIPNVQEDILEKTAQNLLNKKEMRQKLTDKIEENKLVAVLKEAITLENQEITADEFVKLFEQK